MRSSTAKICATAFAVLLLSTFLPRAEAAATPPTGASDGAGAASSSSAVAEPGASIPVSGAAAVPYARGMDVGVPKVELFLGYSYLTSVPEPAAGNRLAWLNGGSTSIAYNFNRHLGLVGDFGGFNDTRLLVQGANPSVVENSSGTAYTFLFGPRLSFRNHERLTPFVQVLLGGIHASPVTYTTGCTGVGCTALPVETSFAVAAGGGLDINFHHHLALRLIQAEYLMSNFENRTTGKGATQNDMRLSTGIVFRFGGAPHVAELQPVTYACFVSPASVYRGDSIAVTGTAMNLDPAKTAAYTWSADGGTITGISSTTTIDTTNATPGTYTLKGHVSESSKPSENADCTATYAVKAYEPPTVSCTANPSAVLSGASSTITATGISPQNRPLTYSYSSTSGSVSGSSTTVTLVTTGSPAGAINVTCNVADDKGQTASANTQVNVALPVVAPKPMTSALCPVNFDRDAKRPSRVDNEAKACLDQIALNLQQDSGATLALVGNASGGEKKSAKLAAARAVNTKAYLVGEKGIDSSRIAVYTGSQDGKIVSTILIPAEATFDDGGDTAVH